MIEETKYLDWQGNIIQPGDTIKLICIEKPNSDKLYPSENPMEDKLYVLPEHFNLNKPIHHYCLVPKDAGHKNVFEVLESKEVESFEVNEELIPVIKIAKFNVMFLEHYLDLINNYMNNLIVAIEGKSDNESMFYEKYFEL